MGMGLQMMVFVIGALVGAVVVIGLLVAVVPDPAAEPRRREAERVRQAQREITEISHRMQDAILDDALQRALAKRPGNSGAPGRQ